MSSSLSSSERSQNYTRYGYGMTQRPQSRHMTINWFQGLWRGLPLGLEAPSGSSCTLPTGLQIFTVHPYRYRRKHSHRSHLGRVEVDTVHCNLNPPHSRWRNPGQLNLRTQRT